MWKIFQMVNKSVNRWTKKTRKQRPQAQKPIFLGLESEKSENQVSHFEIFEKDLKFVHGISVHNGSDAFPNELARFRI